MENMESKELATTVPTSSNVLFDHADMHFMLTHNLGLRLTINAAEEAQNGGFGDTIPLGHLAGAKDILTFVTLALHLKEHPTNQDVKTELEDIYHRYTNYRNNKDPKRKSLNYLPDLIITYAQSANIGDAHLLTTETKRLPTSEEKYLSHCYIFSGGALLPTFVFDKQSQHYDSLPNLRLELTKNFNQRLQDRLAYNHNPYFLTHDAMHYALLGSSNSGRFSSAYDMSHYPMGKAGKSPFEGSDVLQTIPFDISTALDTHQKNIRQWLKDHLNPESIVPKPAIPIPDPEPTCTPNAPISQPFYRNSGTVAALVVLGAFATMKVVNYFQAEHDSDFRP